jgi:2'-5' RNA ligase
MIKRLFFGIEVHAPWPSSLPHGRLLDEAHRHLTLAFLGEIPYLDLLKLLEDFPRPTFQVGSVGIFDTCLCLPSRHPHVVAWHAQWLDAHSGIIPFQQAVVAWLIQHHYAVDTYHKEWMPHVTLCRQPFDFHAWKTSFTPLPFYTGSIHLYESQRNLAYTPLWSLMIQPPFIEIEYMADMAFKIYGETIQQLYHHAFTALAFKYPAFLDFFNSTAQPYTLDDLIIELNQLISQTDQAVGCPLKAVSFHGEIASFNDMLLQWEMVVDV